MFDKLIHQAEGIAVFAEIGFSFGLYGIRFPADIAGLFRYAPIELLFKLWVHDFPMSLSNLRPMCAICFQNPQNLYRDRASLSHGRSLISVPRFLMFCSFF
jgi:hypothetical protein